MSNIVTIPRDDLTDLAREINSIVGDVVSARVRVSILLGKAKILCREAGITFKSWAADNIEMTYNEANRLANIGLQPDPQKALAYRQDAVNRARDEYNERQKVGFRKPTPGTIIEYEDEDGEEDEDETPSNQLPTHMRVRGFMHRAKEAKEMAEADDMAGIETTDAMRTAASEAAKAWIELLANLEGD